MNPTDTTLHFVVLIPAGGKGVRLGAAVPKQYLELLGSPILLHTLAAFDAIPACRRIIVAADDTDAVQHLIETKKWATPVEIVKGGITRQDSVWNALSRVTEDDELVLVHDAARPCIAAAEIKSVAEAVKEHGAALLALHARDTVKLAIDTFVDKTVPRDYVWLAQTPQGARAGILRNALQRARKDGVTGTDEAMLLERLGLPVALVPGSPYNIKITTREDVQLAEAILQTRRART